MQIEDLNNEYLRLKSAVEKYKEDLKQCDKDLQVALKDKENAENALKTAKPKEKKKFQEDLNKAITAIEDAYSKIEFYKGKQENNEKTMEEMINAVKSTPEIEEQCKRAIDIRTDRQIAKFEKQKKEQEDKKTALIGLKNIIDRHPQAIQFVNEIETASLQLSKKEIEIKDIQDQIDKLDPKDPDYATEKAKLEVDKTKLEGDCSSLKITRQSSRDQLKKLLNNPKYNEHIDNLTTRSALDKNINNCDRLIRRSENKIHDYQYAKDSLYKENQPEPTTVPTKWETFKEDIKSVFSKKEPGDSSRLGKLGRAIKNLFTKQEKLPAPTPTPTPTPITSFKDEIKLNNNIMSYEVVQDVYKQTINEKVNEGKQAREADDGSR